MSTNLAINKRTYILVKRAISSAETDGLVLFSTRRRCASQISCYRSGDGKEDIRILGWGTADTTSMMCPFESPLDDPQLPVRLNLLASRGVAKKIQSGAATCPRKEQNFKVRHLMMRRKERKKKSYLFSHPTLHGHLFGTRFDRVLRGAPKRRVLNRNFVVVVATATVAAAA